jgi:hypothetical protein
MSWPNALYLSVQTLCLTAFAGLALATGHVWWTAGASVAYALTWVLGLGQLYTNEAEQQSEKAAERAPLEKGD